MLANLNVSDLLKSLKVKDIEDGKKIFDILVAFFSYMDVGDKISTSYINFTKIDSNLIHLDVAINSDEIVNSLEKSKIIKLIN